MKIYNSILFSAVLGLSACDNSQPAESSKAPKIQTMEDLNEHVKTSRNLEFAYEFSNEQSGIQFTFELYSGYPDPENTAGPKQYTAIYRNDKEVSQAIENKEGKYFVSLNEYIDYFETGDEVSFYKGENNLIELGFEIKRIK